MTPTTPKMLTFRPGNYIRRFSYRFEVVVKDLGEWRPGFYSEFCCASHEHSGLLWVAIKNIVKSRNPYFLKISMF